MDKAEILSRLKKEKLIAVIRTDYDSAVQKINAILKGGIYFIEITLTMPNSLEILKNVKLMCKEDKIVVGAGTVLDPISARTAMLYGADFIVSPAFDEGTAKICNLYKKVYIPGIQTSTDIKTCLSCGVDIMKLFPGNHFDMDIIKTFKGPYPQADFLVTGGINLTTMTEWLKNGALAVGVGGELTGYSEKDNALIQEKSEQFVKQISPDRIH